MRSLLLKQTQGCVGCLKIRNFILKMNLVVCSANIDSKLSELQKILKLQQTPHLFKQILQFYCSIAEYYLYKEMIYILSTLLIFITHYSCNFFIREFPVESIGKCRSAGICYNHYWNLQQQL